MGRLPGDRNPEIFRVETNATPTIPSAPGGARAVLTWCVGTREVCRREVILLCSGPTGGTVVASCLTLLFLVTLFIDDVLAAPYVDPSPLFTAYPLVLVAVAPAATMRAIAGERQDGRLEHLLGLPLTPEQLVFGKILGSWILLATAFVGALGIPASLHGLGGIEPSVLAGAAVGWSALAAAFCAVGVFASTIARSQAAAYLVGLLACLGLWIIDKVAPLLPARLAPLAEALSMDHHFRGMAHGLLVLGDLTYYLAVVLGCGMLAALRLRSERCL